MHPYQVGMVSPTGNGRKSRGVASPEPLGPAPTIVREDGVSFAQCPSCGERLTLGTASGHTIHTPSDLAALLVVEMSALEREELRVALLNTRNRVLAVVTVYMGNVSSSLVRVG